MSDLSLNTQKFNSQKLNYLKRNGMEDKIT